jgi:hypothetical protein
MIQKNTKMKREYNGYGRTINSREANVSFRNSSHKAKNIYARADNNNHQSINQSINQSS